LNDPNNQNSQNNIIEEDEDETAMIH